MHWKMNFAENFADFLANVKTIDEIANKKLSPILLRIVSHERPNWTPIIANFI